MCECVNGRQEANSKGMANAVSRLEKAIFFGGDHGIINAVRGSQQMGVVLRKATFRISGDVVMFKLCVVDDARFVQSFDERLNNLRLFCVLEKLLVFMPESGADKRLDSSFINMT